MGRELTPAHFNPTLVQLESHFRVTRQWLKDDFNPTLVQLEFACKSDGSAIQRFTFQSHIGAIRIILKNRKGETNAIFQSHIGAIRISDASRDFQGYGEISIPHWCN